MANNGGRQGGGGGNQSNMNEHVEFTVKVRSGHFTKIALLGLLFDDLCY